MENGFVGGIFPAPLYTWGGDSAGETTNIFWVHWGSLLVEEVVRPATVYICKRKCLENGEWSEGLSYCVGEEASSRTRGEDVGRNSSSH